MMLLSCRGRAASGLAYVVCAAAFVPLVACRSSVTERGSTPEAGARLRPLNLVVVTIDTLRADRLHCYGNAHIETPTLDGLAAKGALFENAVSQVPLTPPSHASIFTGTYPTVHHVRNAGGFALQSSSVTLAKILQSQGWDTAAFIGASVLKKATGFDQGFDVYDDQMPKPDKSLQEREYPERRAAVVVDHALQWLNAQSGKPFFVWLHMYDPHEPYEPPAPFRERYRYNLYDGEVAYADQQLGRFLATIGARSGAAQTLIVVLADHGESLGEHGEFTHGVFLYDSTLRIPLILAGPGVPAGVRVQQQARTIDVLPTIMALLGGQPPPACQGVSLVPAFTGQSVATTYSYAESLYPKMNMGWAELRAIRSTKWKYVRAPKPELYDLAQDPGEKTNVIEAHPKEYRELDAQFKVLIGTGADVPEKVSSSQLDSHTMDQLKSLGYLSGFSPREFELNGKGVDPKDHLATLQTFQTVLGPDSARIPAARRLDLLRQTLTSDPTNPSLYFYLGTEYEKTGHYDQAIQVYESAQRQGILNGRLLSRLGDLLVRGGKKDQAIVAYEKAAQFNPADVESEINLATAYLEQGKLADADRCFRWALANGESAPAYNGLGLIAIQRQDPAGARTHFERAVALDPDLVAAQLNLGLIYKMAGDIPRARACFEAFLAKAPRAQYATIIPQVRDELKALH